MRARIRRFVGMKVTRRGRGLTSEDWGEAVANTNCTQNDNGPGAPGPAPARHGAKQLSEGKTPEQVAKGSGHEEDSRMDLRTTKD